VFGSKVKRARARGDVEALLELLEGEAPRDRADAANALPTVEIGPWRDRAIRGLLLAAQDLDDRVRGQAVFALGELKVEEARELFLQALSDTEWSVRVFASLAVARTEDRRSVPRLRELLSDDMWLVRMHAAWSLGELATPDDIEARHALERIAEGDPERDVRRAAREALAALDDQA